MTLTRSLALGLLVALPSMGCMSEFTYVDDVIDNGGFNRGNNTTDIQINNARLDGQVGFVPVSQPANVDAYGDGSYFNGVFTVENNRGLAMVIVDMWNTDLRSLPVGRSSASDVHVTLCGDNSQGSNWFDVPADNVEIEVTQPDPDAPSTRNVKLHIVGPSLNSRESVPVETSFTMQ
jgi:hypothetical protein